jgi:3-oxoacyl-[acyl-carrier protein] reductase
MSMTPARTALVTGASRGIGAAIARRLAATGLRVALTYRSAQEEAEALAEEIEGKAYPLDLSTSEGIAPFARRLEEDLGGVQVLVHNAGLTRDTVLAFLSEADWDLVHNTNLKGPVLLTRALLKGMIRERWGRIISIGSVSGILGHPGQTSYSSAKGGLAAFTKTAALELARYHVTANTVAPGFIETDMLAGLPEDRLVEFRRQIPLKRFGRSEEVAALVAFLASEEAGYITGQTLRIDGGLITA